MNSLRAKRPSFIAARRRAISDRESRPFFRQDWASFLAMNGYLRCNDLVCDALARAVERRTKSSSCPGRAAIRATRLSKAPGFTILRRFCVCLAAVSSICSMAIRAPIAKQSQLDLGATVERLADVDNTNDLDCSLRDQGLRCRRHFSNTTAHLAGALGQETSPRSVWRWAHVVLVPRPDDSPFYPRVRLQTPAAETAWERTNGPNRGGDHGTVKEFGKHAAQPEFDASLRLREAMVRTPEQICGRRARLSSLPRR